MVIAQDTVQIPLAMHTNLSNLHILLQSDPTILCGDLSQSSMNFFTAFFFWLDRSSVFIRIMRVDRNCPSLALYAFFFNRINSV